MVVRGAIPRSPRLQIKGAPSGLPVLGNGILPVSPRCYGSMSVSKTDGLGSIPRGGANDR